MPQNSGRVEHDKTSKEEASVQVGTRALGMAFFGGHDIKSRAAAKRRPSAPSSCWCDWQDRGQRKKASLAGRRL